MNAQKMETMALEQAAKSGFGMILDVDTVIAHEIDVSNTGTASVFLTKKKQLLCYIHAQSHLTLGDIRKIIARMGLKAELYLPPKGHPHYFDDIGVAKFREVFPGRTPAGEHDLAYYRTLAPYNPALVMIAEVSNGVIMQHDRDARTGWRPSVKFAYRRIKTS